MGKVKDVTVGKCEVCGEDTGIDSPRVCYGCAMSEQDGVSEAPEDTRTSINEPVPF